MNESINSSFSPPPAIEYLSNLDPQFILGILLAIAAIFIFSYQQFDILTFPRSEKQPETLLKPSVLARARDYTKGLILYASLLLFFFFLLTFVGPSMLQSVLPIKIPSPPQSYPVWLALVLIGVIPNIPWVSGLEVQCRQLAHRYAGIPSEVTEIADRLYLAEFRYANYKEVRAEEPLSFLEENDFEQTQEIFKLWVRICCLLWHLQNDKHKTFDPPLLARCRPDIESMMEDVRRLAEDVRDYKEKGCDPKTARGRTLRRELDALYRRVLVLVSCLVRRRLTSDASLEDAFGRIGFDLPPTARSGLLGDSMIVTGFIMAVLLVGLAELWVMFGSNSAIGEIGKGLPPGMRLNEDWLPALVWSFGIVVQTCGAAFAALGWRAWRISRGSWEDRPRDYVAVSAIGMLVSILCLMAYGLIFNLIIQIMHGDPQFILENFWILVQMKQYLPFLVPAAATAACAAFLLGGRSSNRDALGKLNVRRILWQSLLMGILSGVTGAIASKMNWELQMDQLRDQIAKGQFDESAVQAIGSVGLNAAQLIYISAAGSMSTIAGLILGSLLPCWHRKAISEPRTPQIREDLNRFLKQAQQVCGSADWMFEPNLDLGGISPAEAIRFRAKIGDVHELLTRKDGGVGIGAGTVVRLVGALPGP